MVNLWLILAVIAAPLHWLARLRHWRWLDLITKPLVLLFLIFWSLSITRWEGGMLWFGLALVFSLLGDILLMLPPRVFLGGLVAFFIAHIWFIIGFCSPSIILHPSFLLVAVAVLLYQIVFIGKLIKSLRDKSYSRRFIIPVVIYGTVIGLMFLSSCQVLFRPEWGVSAFLAILGAGLFAISDSLLSYNRFVKPIRNGRMWVMITYHLGQIGILAAAILRFAIQSGRIQ